RSKAPLRIVLVYWPTLLAVHAGPARGGGAPAHHGGCRHDAGYPYPDPAHPERRGTAHQERPLLECDADPREPDRARLPPVRQGAAPPRPDLAPSRVERCPAKGRLSGTFTQTRRRCRIAEGVYNAQRDFHALRTHIHVELKRDGCPSRSAGSSWVRGSTT